MKAKILTITALALIAGVVSLAGVSPAFAKDRNQNHEIKPVEKQSADTRNNSKDSISNDNTHYSVSSVDISGKENSNDRNSMSETKNSKDSSVNDNSIDVNQTEVQTETNS